MSEATTQFERELRALINRYAQESDLTVGELVGALTIEAHRMATKLDLKNSKEG